MCHPDADHFCRRPHACSGARDALTTDAARSTCCISRREQRLRNFLSELNVEPDHAPSRESWSARKRSLFSVMEPGDANMGKRRLGHICEWATPLQKKPSHLLYEDGRPEASLISLPLTPNVGSSVSMKTAVDERRNETRSLFEILSSFTLT